VFFTAVVVLLATAAASDACHSGQDPCFDQALSNLCEMREAIRAAAELAASRGRGVRVIRALHFPLERASRWLSTSRTTPLSRRAVGAHPVRFTESRNGRARSVDAFLTLLNRLSPGTLLPMTGRVVDAVVGAERCVKSLSEWVETQNVSSRAPRRSGRRRTGPPQERQHRRRGASPHSPHTAPCDT
jgi:hypothetical protein